MFRAEREQGSRTVRLSGELDLATVAELDRAICPLTGAGGDIRLEATELEFIDSTGVHALLRAGQALDGRGRVVIVAARPPVRRVFALLGADDWDRLLVLE